MASRPITHRSVIPEYRRRAVVLFSGGLDSTTCLAWAIDAVGTDGVLPLSFDYGQRHSVELACAQKITRLLGVRDTEILPMPPTTSVPGRTLLFIAAAAAFAARHGAWDLVIGGSVTESAGHLDGGGELVAAAREALRSTFEEPWVLHAPLIESSKAETFALAERLGRLELVVGETHSCHLGAHTIDDRHSWGYGCGMCPACTERARGWHQYRATEKTAARASEGDRPVAPASSCRDRSVSNPVRVISDPH